MNITNAGEYNFNADSTIKNGVSLDARNRRLLITSLNHKLTINGNIVANGTGSGDINSLFTTKGIIIQTGSLDVKGEINTTGYGGWDSRTTISLLDQNGTNSFNKVYTHTGTNVIISNGTTTIQELESFNYGINNSGRNYIIGESGALTINHVLSNHGSYNIIGVGYKSNAPTSAITFNSSRSTDTNTPASLKITTMEAKNDAYGGGHNQIFLKGNSKAEIETVTSHDLGQHTFTLGEAPTSSTSRTDSSPTLKITTLRTYSSKWGEGHNTITAYTGNVEIKDVLSENALNTITIKNASLNITGTLSARWTEWGGAGKNVITLEDSQATINNVSVRGHTDKANQITLKGVVRLQ